MNLLLDSNILLWWLTDSPRLEPTDRTHIVASASASVSAASVWELGIKQASGKLQTPGALIPAARAAGFALLDITPQDAQAAAELPMLHRDPFDRMLVAQAIGRGLTLMTSDRRLSEYPVAVLLVN